MSDLVDVEEALQALDAALEDARYTGGDPGHVWAAKRRERFASTVLALYDVVDGRTVAPTDAEIDAHEAAGGGWLVTYTTCHTRPGAVHVEVLHNAVAVRRHLDRAYRNGDDTRTLRWRALDKNGALCAWPGGAVGVLRAAQVDAVLRRLVRFEQGASHAHLRCGVWDPDNGDIAGSPCARCHAFADARELVGEARWRVHGEPARADPDGDTVACGRADCGCSKGGAPRDAAPRPEALDAG